jgi:FkbM family methyltransferase
MAVRDRYADLKERVETDSPVIVDGGANNGSTTGSFLKQYKKPTIHAFEPIPELVKTIKELYGSKEGVHIYEKALGSTNEKLSFKVVNNFVSSSVLEPSELNRSYHGEVMDIKETITVEQVRLDSVISGDVDILKLDLQGYELEALKGSEGILDRVKMITTEVEFVSLYDGQPLFGDIDVFLRPKGFKLLNLYELYTHPDGQLTAGDAVYLNERFFKG